MLIPTVKAYGGDCLEILDRVKTGSVDMVLTDPPWGKTRCIWDIQVDSGLLWKQFRRILKADGILALYAQEPYMSRMICDGVDWYRHKWIFEKSKASGAPNVKKMPLNAHDEIAIFSPKGTEGRYEPQMIQKDPYDKGLVKKQRVGDVYGTLHQVTVKNTTGLRFPRTVQHFEEASDDAMVSSLQYFKTPESEPFPTLHVTQKAQAGLRFLIRTYTRAGQLILDPCAGSFSAGVASMYEDRRFIGIELDAEFYAKGVAWMKAEAAGLGYLVQASAKDAKERIRNVLQRSDHKVALLP